MGILNVTPDSFSDGGRYVDVDTAVSHGLTMARDGAQVIDVGGESTRPGALAVGVDEQIARTRGVIERLAAALRDAGSQTVISIDTTLATVAEAALEAGAVIINDVTGGRGDAAMLPLAAAGRAAVVLMHMQGQPRTMQNDPRYGDVVEEVRTFLLERVEAAMVAGVPREAIMIDPGIGFGKTFEHNLALLARLDRFVDTGLPVLLGASRKRTLRRLVQGESARDEQSPLPRPDEVDGATAATTALGVMAGVQAFRVHDVKINRQAADTACFIKRTGGSLP